MSKKNPRFGYFLVVPRNPRDHELSAMMQARLQEDDGTHELNTSEGTNAFVVKGSEAKIRAVAGGGRAEVVSDRDTRRIEALKKRRPELALIIIALTCGEADEKVWDDLEEEQRREHGTGLLPERADHRPLRGAA